MHGRVFWSLLIKMIQTEAIKCNCIRKIHCPIYKGGPVGAFSETISAKVYQVDTNTLSEDILVGKTYLQGSEALVVMDGGWPMNGERLRSI